MNAHAQTCIAIDCRMLGMSGIGVYLENLVPEVLRLLPQHHFRLIGPVETLHSLALPPEANVVLRSCSAPIYSVQEQVRMPLAAQGAKLLWVPHYNIPLLTRVPLMVTVHDVAHLVLPEVTRSVLRQVYARLLFAGVRRKAATILTVSQFTADEFVRHVGRPQGTLRVVHNGVDAAWFAKEARQQHTGAETPPYFIAVGNLKAHKRIDVLCRAFAAVQGEMPHNLVLVGKHDGFISGGQSIEELMALAPGRIHCTGTLDTQCLRELVRGATALVFPSSYEGFGLPPLEALAAGVPVIAADIPPVREVCGEWVTYFAVDATSTLAAALVHGARTRPHAEEGRRHAARFTWQAAGEAVAGELRALCPAPHTAA